MNNDRMNELTVNDIIRKVNDRIEDILLFEDHVHNKFIKIDETLKTILTVIIGYWFGSIGMQSVRPTQASTSVQHANTVVTNESKETEVRK